MTTGADDDAARRRALRRRHLHERQAVLFGTLITALVAAALLGLSVWFGAIPAPFNVPFASPSPTATSVPQPCPPPDALPVPYDQISVNVYNGSTRVGIAAQTSTELAARGLVVISTANDPAGRYDGSTLVRSGTGGLAHAYTVAAIFPDAVVQLDGREDATVDVTLGPRYDQMRTPEEASLDPGLPIPAPEGCFDPANPAGSADVADGTVDG